MAINHESLQPGIRRCQNILADIRVKTGLMFFEIGGIDTKDESLAEKVLPILAAWVDKVEEDNCRAALESRFRTPHAYSYLPQIIRWWTRERYNIASSLLTQCIATLVRPKDAVAVWEAYVSMETKPSDFWALGAKLASFPQTRDRVVPVLLGILKNKSYELSDIRFILQVDHPAVRSLAVELSESSHPQLRILAKRALKTRLGPKQLWQVDSMGPDRAAQIYGTEVDLTELEKELETVCSRYDLKFPKGFHAEAQLSTAPVDEWLVVKSMGSPTSRRRLWLRLEDVDVVELVVT